MRRINLITAALLMLLGVLTLAAPASGQVSYHACPGKVPYAGYSGYPFWRGIKARATPCRAAKRVVREATNRWSETPGHARIGKVIRLRASVAGGASYRCVFRWGPSSGAPLFQHINQVGCEVRGGKRIRFRSVPAGD